MSFTSHSPLNIWETTRYTGWACSVYHCVSDYGLWGCN